MRQRGPRAPEGRLDLSALGEEQLAYLEDLYAGPDEEEGATQ